MYGDYAVCREGGVAAVYLQGLVFSMCCLCHRDRLGSHPLLTHTADIDIIIMLAIIDEVLSKTNESSVHT